MGRREQLHEKLKKLLGSNHVYYQAPEDLKMEYPCIRYSKSNIVSTHADNIKYANNDRYEIIVISKLPDNAVIGKILEFPYSLHDRHYVSNNLNHDVIILYF